LIALISQTNAENNYVQSLSRIVTATSPVSCGHPITFVLDVGPPHVRHPDRRFMDTAETRDAAV
jgi:hypothetical protein